MKSILKFLIVTAAAIVFSAGVCDARPVPGRPAAGLSFDKSIYTLRYNAVGDYRYKFDDYLQYVPAGVMVGLKAFGYESRSSWGRMIVSDAFSTAVMAAAVNGIKYTVSRLRPDGSAYNSFPSGHTATSFMVAAMLHEEYGWRSPWFSLGGYALASVTGVSRIINNKHWTSDVIAGAAIGIASVKLGYWLADLIFKEKYLDSQYAEPRFGFDDYGKYFDIGLYFGYRFFFGDTGMPSGKGNLKGGGTSGLEMSVPVAASSALKGSAGVAARVGANSYIADNLLTFNTYDFMAGGYWRHPFARILEVGARVMAGYSLAGNRQISGPAGILSGIALSAGCSLAIATGENFKIKAFAEYEASRFTSQKPLASSAVLGGSALFFW